MGTPDEVIMQAISCVVVGSNECGVMLDRR